MKILKDVYISNCSVSLSYLAARLNSLDRALIKDVQELLDDYQACLVKNRNRQKKYKHL